MSNVFVNDETLTAIADAIRAKNGETIAYKPSEMPDAISAITSGGGGGGEIVDNGVYDYSKLNKLEITLSNPTHSLDLSDYLTGNEKIIAISAQCYPAGQSGYLSYRIGINNYIKEDGERIYSSVQPLSSYHPNVNTQGEYMNIKPSLILQGVIGYNNQLKTQYFKTKVYIFYYLPQEA